MQFLCGFRMVFGLGFVREPPLQKGVTLEGLSLGSQFQKIPFTCCAAHVMLRVKVLFNLNIMSATVKISLSLNKGPVTLDIGAPLVFQYEKSLT